MKLSKYSLLAIVFFMRRIGKRDASRYTYRL